MKEPPESYVAALAWVMANDPELVPTLEALWEQHLAGSSAATTAIALLTIGWQAGRAWQANAQGEGSV